MTEAAIADIPVAPPTRFKHAVEVRESDPWLTDFRIPPPALIGNSIWILISSSSCLGSLENLSLRWRESPTHTTSWISVTELYIDRLHAEERAASVNVENAPENLFELRRLTGFTWAHLGNLLRVNRRTLNNWAKGAKIREQNRERIAKTLEVLRFADRGSAELNSAALNEQRVQDKLSPFEAIREGSYEIAKQWLSYGLSRPDTGQAVTDTAPQFGEFQPMVMHADADGTEMIESLPDEPAPVSRKRQIRHG